MSRLAPTVMTLASTDAPLSLLGGKGRSLAKLVTSGIPIPDGFLITTDAYKKFIESNNLQGTILKLVSACSSAQSESFNSASLEIKALFDTAKIPDEIATTIIQAYAELNKNEPAVAVRSSATAEDLPGLSFAGQHDSYLNIHGKKALLEAVRRCWASLWTARAISYRQKMEIDQSAVAMCVVVQLMVPADVSGILFTANPTNGDRSEIVVNASFGLGEAIVGGQITPDTFILDRNSLEVKESVTGTKEEMIVSNDTQGTTRQPVSEQQRNQSSLTEGMLHDLAILSLKAEQLFDGVPQDIEWAVVEGKCRLLQSRPITNLPPPLLKNVTWESPTKGTKLIRRQVVENMPGPLSPLFDELYLQVGLERSFDQCMVNFGMPVDIEEIMERPMFITVNGYAYCRASHRSNWQLAKVLPKILLWYATSLRKLLQNAVPHWRDKGLPNYLSTIEPWKKIDLQATSDQQLLNGIRELTIADAIYWFDATVVLAAAKVTDGLLQRFLKSKAISGNLTSGIFLRGFPSKTLEAQEDLEKLAKRIDSNRSLRDLVITTPASDLLEVLKQKSVGRQLLDDILDYLEQYGHQIYSLDFVEPTQKEDPMPVLLSIKELVKKHEYSTAARQKEMTQEREAQIESTIKSLGPLRRWLFRKFLNWAQGFGPHREEALFYVGAAWPTLRSLALELGQRLVNAALLTKPDDVFYLQTKELIEAYTARKENRTLTELKQTVKRRRELREARKRLHPPGMIPEKSKFKLGPFDFSGFETQKRNTKDSMKLNGFAVSPGKVTGKATLILSPADFENMKPESILVCPTTTPAWTPLFAQASGLVTDIGGILAHGSIVAREYNIPAVMGTGNATQRIVTGQQITVDGDEGIVTLLD